jgi:hypothetical protein
MKKRSGVVDPLIVGPSPCRARRSRASDTVVGRCTGYVINYRPAARAAGLMSLAPFHHAGMNDEPSPFSDPPGSNLPDKPLVVKCNYSGWTQKLSFRSARNCTYDMLQEKVLPSLNIPPTLKQHLSDTKAL